MAWIQTIDETEATGELHDVYEAVRGQRGRVANVFKVESLNPGAMKAHCDFYMRLLYGPSGLSRFQREMIALAVSSRNGCSYCATHHSESFGKYAKDTDLVRWVREDHRSAKLTTKDRAMLDYATKLTTSPGRVDRGDIDALRLAGFSDADVLDINLVASYFNFVNRLVLGLGVPLEADSERTYRY
jgi:uncharacterized peroxidase-related enzyme